MAVDRLTPSIFSRTNTLWTNFKGNKRSYGQILVAMEILYCRCTKRAEENKQREIEGNISFRFPESEVVEETDVVFLTSISI